MTLTAHMPPWLHQSLTARLEGVSRNDLAARAEAISERYRNRGNSLAIRTAHDALAYAIVRMPATYAAVRGAMAQAADRLPAFAPQSLLDVGAGPGTATWAARESWASLERATLVDHNPSLLQLGKSLAAACPSALAAEFVEGALPGALDKADGADLVVASYTLAEIIPSELPAVVNRLWALAGQMLAIVEPGTTDGFKRLLACRDRLLALGGHIVSPCTHAAACPLAGAPRWCHFNQRLPRTRDHQLVKAAPVNFEDERYCCLFVSRSEPGPDPRRRILSTPRVSKQNIYLTLCAPEATEQRTITRREKEAYKAARHYDWGDFVDLA